MRALLARRRRKRIQDLANRLGVRYLVLEHHSGWSVQIDGITITRGGAGNPIRRRYPTRNRAEKVLLDELTGMLYHGFGPDGEDLGFDL